MWKIYQSDEGRLNNRLWDAVNSSAGLHDFKVQHTIFHFIVIPHGLEWMFLQIIGCGTGEWSPSTIYISACAKAPTTDQLLMCWLVKVLLFFLKGFGVSWDTCMGMLTVLNTHVPQMHSEMLQMSACSAETSDGGGFA